jgi:hypothetical protein
LNQQQSISAACGKLLDVGKFLFNQKMAKDIDKLLQPPVKSKFKKGAYDIDVNPNGITITF